MIKREFFLLKFFDSGICFLWRHRQTVQKLKTDFINNFFRAAAYF